MNRVLVLALVANLLVSLVSLLLLPERVAIHFGGDGVPNGWAPREIHALLFAVILVFLFLAFRFAPVLRSGRSARLLSIPNKPYWIREANFPRLQQLMSRLMKEFGIIVMVFLLAVQMLVIEANLNHPVRLNEPLFFVVLAGFVGYTLFWSIKFYRVFKVPDSLTR